LLSELRKSGRMNGQRGWNKDCPIGDGASPDRIFGLTEEAALAYGQIMGKALRQGIGMSAQNGMIAAIARVNGGRLVTRNVADFQTVGLELISPWEF
jgi:predicted nucleic acid-binding protein